MLPSKLFSKYLARFDELIAEGEGISQAMIKFSSENYPNAYINNTNNFKTLAKWKINCISLLAHSLPVGNIHKGLINEFRRLEYDNIYFLEVCISNLKAIKEDYEKGFLGNLRLQVEAEIAADYMGQAEQLLNEGQSGKYDHVPAAVLSGAVLEKALRILCEKQIPPVLTVNSKGSPLTLNPLIDALKKVDVFNEIKAKQLRAWADIRNAAAHGNFDKFERSDVEGMIKGISDFLATYMA